MGNAHGAPRHPNGGRDGDGEVGGNGHHHHRRNLSAEDAAREKAQTEALVNEALSKQQDQWELSPSQKRLLRDSWCALQSSIESVGTVTFLQMFETHPETLKPFIPEVDSIQELELNEWYRENLKVHAIRVMAVIEKTMHRLDDEKRAAGILLEYGRRHQGYGVTPIMLEKMAHSFLVAIQPNLEDSWSKEVEEAWLQLFRRIVYFMRLGYSDLDSVATAADLGSGGKRPGSASSSKNSRKNSLVAKAVKEIAKVSGGGGHGGHSGHGDGGDGGGGV